MNDCYSFQNSTGIGISDILESQTIEITNLIDITSNDLFDYTSNTSNDLFDYTSNTSYQLYDFNKYINPLPIIYKETSTGSTIIKITGLDEESEIKFDTAVGNEVKTKIDHEGNLNVYHDLDVSLPTRTEGWWNIHDELTTLIRDGIGLRFDITETQALDAVQSGQIQANSTAIADLGLALGALTTLSIPSIITNVALLETSKLDKSEFDTRSNNLYLYSSNNSNYLINHIDYTSNNLFTKSYDYTFGTSNNLINHINYTSNNLYTEGSNYTLATSNNLINHIEYTSNNLFTKSYDYTFGTSNNLISFTNNTSNYLYKEGSNFTYQTKENINNTNKEGIYTKNFVQSATAKTYAYYPGSRFEVENAIYVRNDYSKDGYTGTLLELRGGSYDPPTPDALYNYIKLDVDNSLSLHTCNQMRLTNFNTYVNSTANIEMNSINNYMSATNKLKLNAPHIYQNNIPSSMILNFYVPFGNWGFYISGQYWYKYMNIENYVKAKTLPDGSKIRVFKIMSIYTANWDRHYGATYFGREIGLPDELTIYMSNKIEYEDGSSITNDNICNCRIYGRSKQTNYGYWLPFNTLNQEIVISNEPNFAFNHLYFATGFRNAMYVSITPLIFDYYNT